MIWSIYSMQQKVIFPHESSRTLGQHSQFNTVNMVILVLHHLEIWEKVLLYLRVEISCNVSFKDINLFTSTNNGFEYFVLNKNWLTTVPLSVPSMHANWPQGYQLLFESEIQNPLRMDHCLKVKTYLPGMNLINCAKSQRVRFEEGLFYVCGDNLKKNVITNAGSPRT